MAEFAYCKTSKNSTNLTMGILIGIDIGGTKMLVAALDSEMNILQRRRLETPEDPLEAMDQLHAMITEVSGGEEVIGIGCSIGGPIDIAAGTVSPLNMKRWRDIPMKQIMEERWACEWAV